MRASCRTPQSLTMGPPTEKAVSIPIKQFELRFKPHDPTFEELEVTARQVGYEPEAN